MCLDRQAYSGAWMTMLQRGGSKAVPCRGYLASSLAATHVGSLLQTILSIDNDEVLLHSADRISYYYAELCLQLAIVATSVSSGVLSPIAAGAAYFLSTPVVPKYGFRTLSVALSVNVCRRQQCAKFRLEPCATSLSDVFWGH